MNQETKDTILTRDCEAVLIPSGDSLSIPEATSVTITQVLGGSYTIMTPYGLARVAGENADALGEEVVPSASTAETGKPEAEGTPPDNEKVWTQLKNVYDPEIPVNIVDLGLVYSCEISKLTDEEGYRVDVKMTLTAPGCGMGPAIAADAKSKVLSVSGIKDAEVEIVWDPPWSQDMITEEGKMMLGLI